MSTILDEIVSAKRIELVDQKNNVSIRELEGMIRDQPNPLDFGLALKGDNIRLIAEVKKASPSKGLLCEDFDPVRLASIYWSRGSGSIGSDRPQVPGRIRAYSTNQKIWCSR